MKQIGYYFHEVLSHRLMWKRFSVRFFLMRHFEPWGLLILMLEAAGFMYGIVTIVHSLLLQQFGVYFIGGIVSLFLSVFFAVLQFFSLLSQYNKVARELKNRNVRVESAYFEKVRPAVLSDETEGFSIVNAGNGDVISRSDDLDKSILLMKHFSITVARGSFPAFKQMLTGRLKEGLQLLLMRTAVNNEGGYFFNGSKVSISSKFYATSEAVRLSRSTYFTACITNYAVSKRLVAEIPDEVIDFSTIFPIENGELLSLSRSALANMIGVSTLCIDSARHPVILTQSHRVNSNPGMLAPSGSGSMDWADLKGYRRASTDLDLLGLVTYSTIRELREECSIPSDRANIIENIPIGFFRYVANGGLPEFISISKCSTSYLNMRPEKREVDSLRARRTIGHKASDVLALCDDILNNSRSSIPLIALCSRLESILNNRLGGESRARVMEFWELTDG